MTGTEAVRYLADALERWHAQAREADSGGDPALNDPAPYAKIRVAANAASRPGAVVSEITLTERQADDFASCLTGPGAYATSAPWALAGLLHTARCARPEDATCWFIACDGDGQPEGQVPLDSDGADGLAKQVSTHQAWMAGEQFLRRECPFQDGSRVRIADGAHVGSARGQFGTVTRVKLASVEPELVWWYSVRLDHDNSGFCQIFTESDLTASPDNCARRHSSSVGQREPEAGE